MFKLPRRSAEAKSGCRFAGAPCSARSVVKLVIPNLMRFCRPPRRGNEKISPGQRRAATAALGCRTSSLYPSLHGLPCRRGGSAWQTMKRGDIHYCSVTQGGASLALGYYLSPRWGFPFASLRSRLAEHLIRLPISRL